MLDPLEVMCFVSLFLVGGKNRRVQIEMIRMH